jgi:hypothetical protein
LISAPATACPRVNFDARRIACASVAAFAVLLILLWTTARIHYVFGGNWTAVFATGESFPTPPDLAAGTWRLKGAGYDGQFYRYLANDPFLQKDYFRYVDAPQLRFRRILVPLTAWMLALGNQRRIDGAYIAVEMFFLALGVYWCARLMVRRGLSPFWGLLFLFVPATIASFDRMLLDGPLTALFAGFLLYCEEERWSGAWVIALLAALTRDTGLLLGGALVLDRLLNRDWRRAVWFASSAIPTVAWYGYVASRLPTDAPNHILTLPVWGLVQRLLLVRPLSEPDARVRLLVQVTDFLAVLGLCIGIVLAVRWLLKARMGPVTISVGFFVALALILGGPSMIDSLGFGRSISPMLFWIMLEAAARRRWIALVPPLLITLSVSLAFISPAFTIAKGLMGR